MNAATRKARVQMERELARIESRPPVEAVPPPLTVQHTLSGAPDGIEAFLLRPELGRGLLRTWDPPRMHAPIIASKNWLTPPPDGGVGLEPDEMWLPLIDSGSLDGWVGRVPALGQRGECTCYFAVAGASVAGQMSVDPDSYLDIFVPPAHRRDGRRAEAAAVGAGQRGDRLVDPGTLARRCDAARGSHARPAGVRPVSGLVEIAPGIKVFADAEQNFWQARRALALVREWARARMVSPHALLVAVLQRVLVSVPPFVVLPPIAADDASLNLFAGVTAPTAGGKDRALDVARRMVRVATGSRSPSVRSGRERAWWTCSRSGTPRTSAR